MSNYYLGQVNTEAENQVFEGFLERNLYENGGASERTRWFYDANGAKLFFFRSGVMVPIGVIGFNTRLFNTPLGLKRGAIAADLCIDKQYRDVQSALSLVELGVMEVLRSPEVDFVYTIPNRSSRGIIKRTGIFESVGIFERYVKLVSFREVTEGKKYRFLTPIIDGLWSTVVNVHNLRWMSYTQDMAKRFASATNVWSEYNNESMVMGVRDESYMSWRYGSDDKYKVFHIEYKGQNAYLVFMIIKDRAYVVDLLYPKDDATMLTRLFVAFERYCHQKDHSMIVVQSLGCDHAVQTLQKKLWFKRHRPTTKELFVSSSDGPLLAYLTTGEKYWFAGDEDDIQ